MNKRHGKLVSATALLILTLAFYGCENPASSSTTPPETDVLKAEDLMKAINAAVNDNAAEIVADKDKATVVLKQTITIGKKPENGDIELAHISIPKGVTLKTDGANGGQIILKGKTLTIDGDGKLFVNQTGDISVNPSDDDKDIGTLIIGKSLTVVAGSEDIIAKAASSKAKYTFDAETIEVPKDTALTVLPTVAGTALKWDTRTLVINGDLDLSAHAADLKVARVVIGDGILTAINTKKLTINNSLEFTADGKGKIVADAGDTIGFGNQAQIIGVEGFEAKVPKKDASNVTVVLPPSTAENDFTQAWTFGTGLKNAADWNIDAKAKKITLKSSTLTPTTSATVFELKKGTKFYFYYQPADGSVTDAEYLAWELNKYIASGGKAIAKNIPNQTNPDDTTDKKTYTFGEVSLTGAATVNANGATDSLGASGLNFNLPRWTTLKLSQSGPLTLSASDDTEIAFTGSGTLSLGGKYALQLTGTATLDLSLLDYKIEVYGDDVFRGNSSIVTTPTSADLTWVFKDDTDYLKFAESLGLAAAALNATGTALLVVNKGIVDGSDSSDGVTLTLADQGEATVYGVSNLVLKGKKDKKGIVKIEGPTGSWDVVLKLASASAEITFDNSFGEIAFGKSTETANGACIDFGTANSLLKNVNVVVASSASQAKVKITMNNDALSSAANGTAGQIQADTVVVANTTLKPVDKAGAIMNWTPAASVAGGAVTGFGTPAKIYVLTGKEATINSNTTFTFTPNGP